MKMTLSVRKRNQRKMASAKITGESDNEDPARGRFEGKLLLRMRMSVVMEMIKKLPIEKLLTTPISSTNAKSDNDCQGFFSGSNLTASGIG